MREVIESAAQLARTTLAAGKNERDETEHILRDRREHPEHWVPIAEAAETYRRLAKQNRTERRAFGREARPRGAGRPRAGRARPLDRAAAAPAARTILAVTIRRGKLPGLISF